MKNKLIYAFSMVLISIQLQAQTVSQMKQIVFLESENNDIAAYKMVASAKIPPLIMAVMNGLSGMIVPITFLLGREQIKDTAVSCFSRESDNELFYDVDNEGKILKTSAVMGTLLGISIGTTVGLAIYTYEQIKTQTAALEKLENLLRSRVNESTENIDITKKVPCSTAQKSPNIASQKWHITIGICSLLSAISIPIIHLLEKNVFHQSDFVNQEKKMYSDTLVSEKVAIMFFSAAIGMASSIVLATVAYKKKQSYNQATKQIESFSSL